MKKKVTIVGLVILVLATFGAALLRSSPDIEVAGLEPAEAVMVVQELEEETAAESEAPPRLRYAVGWPFHELPLVTKFGFAEPQVDVPYSPPPSIYQEAIVRGLPGSPPRAYLTPGGQGPWLLLPLAAAVAFGSAGAEYESTVIPEPSTLLLVATGVLLVGAGAVLRRG